MRGRRESNLKDLKQFCMGYLFFKFMLPFIFITYFNICLPFQQKIYLKCVQIIWHLVKDNMSNYVSKDLKYFWLKLKVKPKKKKKINNPFKIHSHDRGCTEHLSAKD